MFARQLSTMVSSGVRIRDAVSVLSIQTVFSSRFRKILVEVVLLIEGGMGFSEALEHTGVFEPLFINLVKAGETGGVLEETMERVAEFYEGAVDLQNQVKSAMAYPLFMMVFAIGIIGVISVFILPNLISAMGSSFQPTGVVGLLMKTSNTMKNDWPLVLLITISVFAGGFFFFKSKYGKIFKDIMASFFPPVRKLREMTALERFTRTLAVLVSSGVDLPTSLELSAEVSESLRLMKAISLAIDQIKAGEAINRALANQKVFPSLVISMVSTGEETGKLDEVMFKVADFYHAQVETSLKKLVSLVEPIMIMFIGGFIGFLAYAMYQTIFSIEQGVGG